MSWKCPLDADLRSRRSLTRARPCRDGHAEEARAAGREAIGVYEAKGITVEAERAGRLLPEL
jgi:hypothetical protein